MELSKSAFRADQKCFQTGNDGTRQILLCRVTLGRTCEHDPSLANQDLMMDSDDDFHAVVVSVDSVAALGLETTMEWNDN